MTELKKKNNQSEIKEMLIVLNQYNREEINKIVIRLHRMGILTKQQVDDAHELLYAPS